MPRIRIEFDKNNCIGNKACLAMDFKRWKDMGEKVDLIGGKEISEGIFILEGNYSEEEIETIVEGANVCPVNVITVKNLDTGKYLFEGSIKVEDVIEIESNYNDDKDFKLDPEGYFLIRINPEKREIEVGFCKEPNKVAFKFKGKKPVAVYSTIVNYFEKEKIKLRKEHYAYLGRELQKAYIALEKDLDYVQDDELEF